MTRTNVCLVIVIVAFGASVGCDSKPDATVQGSVTINGELASRGTIVFHPIEGGPPAYGRIFENGTFSLRVGQGDLDDVDGGQLHSGEYVVTAVVNMPPAGDETVGAAGPPMPGPRLTAEKYADKETSDLRVTVKPGINVVALELEGAAGDEVPSDEADTEPQADPMADDDTDAATASDSPTDEGTEAASAGSDSGSPSEGEPPAGDSQEPTP